MHKKWLNVAVLTMSATVFLAGCSGTDRRNQRTPESEPSIVSNSAVLNTQTAAISLPLDRYAMSENDVHIMQAAQNIQFEKCLSPNQSTSETARQNARASLIIPAASRDWIYGRWAATGPAGLGAPSSHFTLGSGLNPDPTTANQCVETPEMKSLEPVTRYLGTQGELQKLPSLSFATYKQSMTDSRMISLVNQRSQCIKKRGYQVDETPIQGVVSTKDGAEDKEAALIVEATCSDELNFTQRAADITASYQLQEIEKNKAELQAIKATCDKRVESAKAILANAGIAV